MQTKIEHIAIIMDGNRRWAKSQGLSSSEGHAAGIAALEKIVTATAKMGIKHLTVYALSSENLKNRTKSEIRSLFNLLQKGFVDKAPVLKKQGIKVFFLGNITKLPLPVRLTLKKTEKYLTDGDRLQLNVAINYGARAEIVEAVKRSKKINKLDEESFADLLFTQDIPDPDLIIRTGGEKRLSNFLLWQAAYAELYFTEQLWPDFDSQSLKKAVLDFQKRKRNFGF